MPHVRWPRRRCNRGSEDTRSLACTEEAPVSLVRIVPARGIDRDVAWSDRSSASDRITASVAGDLPGVSRAIWTAPREAERTRQACGIRTP
jgi:hypothetical protein